MRGFFTFAVLLGLAWVVGAWFLMLLIGALHHSWWDVIPTISYAGALEIELVLVVGAFLIGAVKSLVEVVTS
jgi:hypothetical protein